jgi:2,3-bisphosphoglycerate-independent phosphoglycerate mutase
MAKERTGILIILDGFGLNPDSRHNAVAAADAPTLKELLENYPHGEIQASESHVGLPEGFMGNSEVGHLNIGAGRVVYQDFSLISHAIEEETFFENPAFLDLFSKLKAQKGRPALHLMGLVSDGGVHSHISHLFALLELAKRQGTERVWIHLFADGRDTSPTSGVEYTEQLLEHCRSLGLGKIATVSGRFYAMDRDKRWERTEAAYAAVVPRSYWLRM